MPRRTHPVAASKAKRKAHIAAIAAADAARRAKAAYQEQQAELIAPALLRNPTDYRPAILEPAAWPDPAKPAKIVHSFRRVSAIWRLFQRSQHITIAHLKAAKQFTADYEVGCEGARSGGGTAAVGPASDGHPSFHQLAALGRYRATITALGPNDAMIVSYIVLLNRTAAQTADWLHITPAEAVITIASALDRLCEHYNPPVRRHTALVVAAPAPDVSGLPVERVGRWRAAVR